MKEGLRGHEGGFRGIWRRVKRDMDEGLRGYGGYILIAFIGIQYFLMDFN